MPVADGDAAADAHVRATAPRAWHVEHDATTTAEVVAADDRTVTLRYALGGGAPSNQFAALVGAIDGGLAPFDRVTFTARADAPTRVAVDLRPRGRTNPPRWRRSIYLDASPRTFVIAFGDMQPVPRDAAPAVPLSTIDALMFVVDTNNTRPGTSGAVTVGAISWDALH